MAGLSAAFFNAINRSLDVKFVASTGYQPAKGHPTALMIRQDLWDAGQHDASGLKGKNVGWLGNAGATAGYYGHALGRSLGLGYVKPAHAAVGGELQIEILGERKRATVLVDSPYDPENRELRA